MMGRGATTPRELPAARAGVTPWRTAGAAAPVETTIPSTPAQTLADLYAREYAPMVRLAFLLVGSAEVAEDCVQDAFVRLHRRVERLDAPGAYLRTTVVNACRDHLRRQKVRRAFRPDPAPPETIPEVDDELAGLLDGLAERRRTAIVLRFYADLSHDEIAAHLGVRPATARSLVHRGLTELRKELES